MDTKSNIPKTYHGNSNPPWRHKFITPKKQKPIKKSWLDETPAFLRNNNLPHYLSILESSDAAKPTVLSYKAMRSMVAILAHMEDNNRYLFESNDVTPPAHQEDRATASASLVFEKDEDKIQQFVEFIFQNDDDNTTSLSSSSNNTILDNVIMHMEDDMDVIRNGMKIAIQKCAPIVPLELQKECLLQIGSNRGSNRNTYPTKTVATRPAEKGDEDNAQHETGEKATSITTRSTSSRIRYFLSHPKWADPNLILFTTLIQHACKMMNSHHFLQHQHARPDQQSTKNRFNKLATDFYELVCDKMSSSTVLSSIGGPSLVVSSFISNIFSRRKMTFKRRAFKKIIRHFASPPDNEFTRVLSSSINDNVAYHGCTTASPLVIITSTSPRQEGEDEDDDRSNNENNNEVEEEHDEEGSPIHKKVLFGDDKEDPSSSDESLELRIVKEDERRVLKKEQQQKDGKRDHDTKGDFRPPTIYSIRNDWDAQALVLDTNIADNLSKEQQNEIRRKWKEETILIYNAKMRIRTAEAVLQEFNDLRINTIQCS
jgi:hypothetical protein